LVDFHYIKDFVKIICPIHGVFKQRADNHMNGSNCEECTFNGYRLMDDFIKRSNIKHNNFYDYSLVEYVNCRTKICIICPIHGVFYQTPDIHLNGRGCKKCSGYVKLTKDFFILKSKSKHGDFYNYDNSDIINTRTKTKIICPIHGEFLQNVRDHMKGHGCLLCGLKKSSGEDIIEKYFLDNDIEFTKQKKFDGCLDIRQLTFDFYLPYYNVCVEYDGIQHFKSIEYFGGETSLSSYKKRDDIKNKYCETNNIKLFRIKYDDNISEKLKLLFLY